MNNYISNFKKLPTNLAYAFNEPDDQIDVLNNLINQYISDHALTKKVKFTRPPAPWMKDPEIISAKNHVLKTYEIYHVTQIILNPAPVKATRLQGITIKKPYDPKKLLSYETYLVPKIRKKYGKRLIVYLIHQKIQ